MAGSIRKRARDLGITVGAMAPGPLNAITDVAGVRVGHTTLIEGDGHLEVGQGPKRTGVTAILPLDGNVFEERVVGGGFVLNGAGEVSGLTQVVEWGLIETPICLTNTLSVGACSEAVVRYMVETYPEIGREADVIIPIVGECDDSWLNDIAGRHVRHEHVVSAIDSARGGPVLEGNVGGGTGMITCGFKSGIGTSSRVVVESDLQFNVGVLVMSNFGLMPDLRVGGIPLGRILEPEFSHMPTRTHSYGSIIAVLATDAPLTSHQLSRLAKRAAIGIGRMGSYAAHTSGEIVIGFSTANTVPRQSSRPVHRLEMLLDTHMDGLYEATVEATEEAILNSLCMAEELVGYDGHAAPALPLDRVARLFEAQKAALDSVR